MKTFVFFIVDPVGERVGEEALRVTEPGSDLIDNGAAAVFSSVAAKSPERGLCSVAAAGCGGGLSALRISRLDFRPPTGGGGRFTPQPAVWPPPVHMEAAQQLAVPRVHSLVPPVRAERRKEVPSTQDTFHDKRGFSRNWFSLWPFYPSNPEKLA